MNNHLVLLYDSNRSNDLESLLFSVLEDDNNCYSSLFGEGFSCWYKSVDNKLLENVYDLINDDKAKSVVAHMIRTSMLINDFYEFYDIQYDNNIVNGAFVHDVGKLINDRILTLVSSAYGLNRKQRGDVAMHVIDGAMYLEEIDRENLSCFAKFHHNYEKAPVEIRDEIKMLEFFDVVDACCSNREYFFAVPVQKAINMVSEHFSSRYLCYQDQPALDHDIKRGIEYLQSYKFQKDLPK